MSPSWQLRLLLRFWLLKCPQSVQKGQDAHSVLVLFSFLNSQYRRFLSPQGFHPQADMLMDFSRIDLHFHWKGSKLHRVSSPLVGGGLALEPSHWLFSLEVGRSFKAVAFHLEITENSTSRSHSQGCWSHQPEPASNHLCHSQPGRRHQIKHQVVVNLRY